MQYLKDGKSTGPQVGKVLQCLTWTDSVPTIVPIKQLPSIGCGRNELSRAINDRPSLASDGGHHPVRLIIVPEEMLQWFLSKRVCDQLS